MREHSDSSTPTVVSTPSNRDKWIAKRITLSTMERALLGLIAAMLLLGFWQTWKSTHAADGQQES